MVVVLGSNEHEENKNPEITKQNIFPYQYFEHLTSIIS
jgi:hypothetical protein